ncbi:MULTISPECIES: hypothetical protein [unclassified Marinovum]
MAIESLYWKEDLARIAKTIRPVPKPKRWSERAVCTVERDVMIGFFIVRRMIELHKVSSRIAKMKVDVFGTPTVKNVTFLNRFSLEENYDWEAEKLEKKSVAYVCNQSIHAYVSFVLRGTDRNWSDLVVVSDFDRNKAVWRIPFPTIIKLFEETSKGWPSGASWVFDEKMGDYRVTTE